MFSPHTQHTPQLLRPFPQRGAGVRRDMNSTSQNFMVDIGYWLIIILNLELLVLSHPKQAENIKPQTLIDWCILCARSWKEGGSWAQQIQCSYSLQPWFGVQILETCGTTQKPPWKTTLFQSPNDSKYIQGEQEESLGSSNVFLGVFHGFHSFGACLGNTSTFLDPLWTWQHASQAAASADVVLASASPGNRGTTE